MKTSFINKNEEVSLESKFIILFSSQTWGKYIRYGYVVSVALATVTVILSPNWSGCMFPFVIWDRTYTNVVASQVFNADLCLSNWHTLTWHLSERFALYSLQEIWLLATNILATTLNSLLISQYQWRQLIVVANFPKQTNTSDDFGVVADKTSLI